jgi:stress-induced morphogen
MRGKLETKLERALARFFSPTKLRIRNNSLEHSAHPAMSSSRSLETHFSITIKSAKFNSMVSDCELT